MIRVSDSEPYRTSMQASRERANKPRERSDLGRRELGLATALTFGVLLLFFAMPTPDVNESHYLTKARHFWEPDWCAGDLFLDSSSAHWLFFLSFGWMGKFWGLAGLAWIGRLLVWLAMSWVWARWLLLEGVRPILTPVWAAVWLVLIERGNLAGEWVVGGFEAKSLAFVFLIGALGLAAEGRQGAAWLAIGLATSLHFLVGGWFAAAWLISGLAWRRQDGTAVVLADWRELFRDAPGWDGQRSAGTGNPLAVLAGVGLLALAGAAPSLWADWGVDSATRMEAARIQVEHRLAHHQYFSAFATQRVAAFSVLVVLWAGCRLLSATSPALARLHRWVVVSLVFAVAGLVLCAIAEAEGPQSWAFSWLRLYWFRLSDFAVPTAITLTVAIHFSRAQLTGGRGAWLVAAVALLVVACAWDVWERHQDRRPRADQAALPTYVEPRKTNESFRNWVSVCDWCREHTPESAILITPADQQTFKWYAERGEVVCWKDMPQDAASVVEWWRRVNQLVLTQRRYEGGLFAYSDEQLRQFGRQYGADYLVALQRDLERRPGGTGLVQLYPEDPQRRSTYVVLDLRQTD